MIDALQIAASGLRSQQEQIDVISNNVANLQTPGFKKTRVAFVDLASANPAAEGDRRDAVTGAGTAIAAAVPVFSDGDVRMTRNPLDLAIRGNGLFEVLAPDGSRVYTRVGQLRLDEAGRLMTLSGLKLTADVQIPPDATALEVRADGAIHGRLGGDPTPTLLGQLELTAFRDPSALSVLGDGTYGATEAAGDASVGRPGEEGRGTLLAGYLEVANVDMVDEMTALVLAQRAYQLNARVLQASDQILETINNLRR